MRYSRGLNIDLNLWIKDKSPAPKTADLKSKRFEKHKLHLRDSPIELSTVEHYNSICNTAAKLPEFNKQALVQINTNVYNLSGNPTSASANTGHRKLSKIAKDAQETSAVYRRLSPYIHISVLLSLICGAVFAFLFVNELYSLWLIVGTLFIFSLVFAVIGIRQIRRGEAGGRFYAAVSILLVLADYLMASLLLLSAFLEFLFG